MKLKALLAGLVFAAGAVALPASAVVIKYSATLDGHSEAPPNASPGTGTALVTVDLDLLTLRLETDFSDLIGTVTAAHIHCCTAVPGDGTVGVATIMPTFPGFPSSVTSGLYDETFDLKLASSFNPAFITANFDVDGARNKLLAGLDDGTAYLNIHTTVFPGGEIRGFLQQIPEPATFALLLPGLGLMALMRRRETAA
jgi:hypothetical protein